MHTLFVAGPEHSHPFEWQQSTQSLYSGCSPVPAQAAAEVDRRATMVRRLMTTCLNCMLDRRQAIVFQRVKTSLARMSELGEFVWEVVWI
jgi:hypothetical protein